MKKVILILAAISITLLSQSNPVVSNVNVTIEGTTVTVTYDVTDAEQGTVNIGMKISTDGGAYWDYNPTNPAPFGDIGNGVAIGTGKQITWTLSSGNPDVIVMINANDGQVGGANCGTVDYGGKTYNTIMIGDQCWLKENLNIGSRIDVALDQTNNGILEKYCLFDDGNNCNTYGGLYQWAEAVQYLNGATNTTIPNPTFSGNVRGICPSGWHIPTYAELIKLQTIVNIDGNSMISVGQGIDGGAGTNTSGFSALMSGCRIGWGGSGYLGHSEFFWCSTVGNATGATYMRLIFDTVTPHLEGGSKIDGYSVRCIKD